MLNFNFEQEIKNRLQNSFSEDILAKTLSTNDGNGTSNAIATIIDPIVRQYVSSNATYWGVAYKEMLNGTNVFTWLNETSAPASYSVPDGSNITSSDYGHSKSFVSTSPIYNAGWISGPARRATANTFDLLQRRVVAGTRQFVKDLNSKIINGDVANNSTFVGLKAGLLAAGTHTVAGSGATLSHATLNGMLINQDANGYDTSKCVFLASADVYAQLKDAAYNNVRNMGITDFAQIGYAMSPMKAQLSYGGVPVLLEPALGLHGGTQNLILVSLDQNDVVVPMSHDITVRLDLPEDTVQDRKPVRLEAELGFALCQPNSGIIAPGIIVSGSFS